MPLFVLLQNYTEQGVRTLKESPQRVRQNIQNAEGQGFKVHALAFTMGQYDLVAIVEAPSDEAAMTAVLGLATQGNARTTTLRGFTIDEFAQLVGQLP